MSITLTASAPQAAVQQPAGPLASAVRAAAYKAGLSPELTAFYERRSWRPLWIEDRALAPAAYDVVAALATAGSHGLDPAAYDPIGLDALITATPIGDRAGLARAEIALSQAFARFVADLHTPSAGAEMAYTDPATPRPPVTHGAALATIAAADSPEAGVADALRMHPIYEALREVLAARRAGAPAPSEALILANMDRARALPADPGPRYVLVDAAAARLWLFEDGQVADTMSVVVGRRSDPTPVMAGMIRYAQFNPYWNLPEGMVRDELAPRVLREGTGFLAAEDIEILSDWSDAPRLIDPAEVDWRAVAAGETYVRVRRRPGPNNILGRVKLMLPNKLGIYLHDTPDRTAFAAARRTLSAGCIRLEDAMRLTHRLLGEPVGPEPMGWDARVDLPEPVPVYIVYFTLAPEGGGLVARQDIYDRDAPLLAAKSRRRAAAA